MAETACAGCGMVTSDAEYHPFAACMMMEGDRNRSGSLGGTTVRANLRAVVEYGMRAQRQGISLNRAMSDLTSVKSAPKRSYPPCPQCRGRTP